ATAAVTVMSLATLFALPVVTLLFALVGVPTPPSLAWVAVGGAIAFFVLFGLGTVLLVTDGLLHWTARLAERVAVRLHRDVTAAGIVQERDRLRDVLGERWPRALASSVAIWGFDYLSLVAVLVALHTHPKLSVVLLAFTAAKILGMVPITPGGLGIVEAGLTGTLVLAGIPGSEALLATLAYRIVSYWMSLPAGLIAYLLFKRRYPAVANRTAPAT
ncbi:MAG TPA: flippase-like domain-containing protein, partial [Acidimicrobiia bacterium]|nr:flippase-like domain-containing protein [Acidimicrobiia bacterium]